MAPHLLLLYSTPGTRRFFFFYSLPAATTKPMCEFRVSASVRPRLNEDQGAVQHGRTFDTLIVLSTQ